VRHDGTAGGAGAVRVDVLGPLQLVLDRQPVEVPGPKRRALLALLAMGEGRGVTVDALVDALWPSDPPETARTTLQSHVSRLRRHLGAGADRLEAADGGYRLTLGDDGLDAARARHLLAEARALADDDPAAAHALLEEAHGLWRGPSLADLRDVGPLASWAVALDEIDREIGDLTIACALEAGRLDGVVSLAAAAVERDPLREPAALLLMRALAATGRTAEALRVGYAFRRRLAEEVGLDPSPALGRLERELAAGAAEQAHLATPEWRIPPAGTPLRGRDTEVAAVQRLVAHERLVTVVGPGGVGKTRLALEVARRTDPVTLLRLAAVTDPSGIEPSLASTLGLRVATEHVLAAAATLLGAGPHLLVVDNCEHLLGAVEPLATALLDACPELTVLATSREPLGHPSEALFRLAPLALPDPRRTEEADRAPAVAVFLDRASRVRPGFSPDREDLALISDLVRRLDGIPFAIELAAGRLSSFGLADLHARLDRVLDLLADPGAGADPRHRTLRSTLEWSYELLPATEQRLFRHLSVFPDGFDLATAERVAADLDLDADPAAVLAHLVDASLVDAELHPGARYRMLDVLRTFGLDRLAAEAEEVEASGRLVRWAVELADRIGATAVSDEEPDADTTLRRELGNLRAAWRLMLREGRLSDATEVVTAIAEAAMWRDLPEIWHWAAELGEVREVRQHPRACAALGAAASTVWLLGDAGRAEWLAREALELPAEDADRWWALAALANVALSRGDDEAAIARSLEAAACDRPPNESLGIAALAATYAGDLDRARSFHEQLEAIASFPSLQSLAAYVAGEIDNAAGRPGDAEVHYRRAIELARTSGAAFAEGIATVGLLTVQAASGRVDDALRGYRDLIDYWERTGSWIQQWTTLRNLARLLRSVGDVEAALFLEVAADHAPDAPTVTDAMSRGEPPTSGGLAAEVESELRTSAVSTSRSEVLGFARDAISRALDEGDHR
jgi:predicted ATPase/DNA-binding SARP family transcriptional activator